MIGERPIHVITDVQIGIAVAIEVGPAGAAAPRARVLQADLARDIDELPALAGILGIGPRRLLAVAQFGVVVAHLGVVVGFGLCRLLVGAIGVSGGSGEQDHAVAEAGAKAF